MKKYILIIILLLIPIISFTQTNITLGVKSGPNLSNLVGDYPDNFDYTKIKRRLDFHIGGYGEYNINDKFFIQAELLISRQGGKFVVKEYYNDKVNNDHVSNIQTTYLTYLHFPVILKYEIFKNVKLEFGPQISRILKAKSKKEYINTRYSSENENITIDLLSDDSFEFVGRTGKPALNKIDFGFIFGTSYNLNEKIIIQGRYNLGLLAIDKHSRNNSNNDSWNLKNSVFQLSVGYRLY